MLATFEGDEVDDMSNSAMARLDAAIDKFDDVLAERLRREKVAMEREDAARDAARAQRARDAMHERREIAARYDDSFRSFGTTVPEAADDESPVRYRARLFNRLARRLSPDHDLASLRADDLGSVASASSLRVQRVLLEGRRDAGARRRTENLPRYERNDSRTRVDDMGGRTTEFLGRELFIKSMGREGRRVSRIVDPTHGVAIWGPISIGCAEPRLLRSHRQEDRRHGA